VVADDEALPAELGIGVLDRPGRREAARFGHEAKARFSARQQPRPALQMAVGAFRVETMPPRIG
jgi:hypothetical protein